MLFANVAFAQLNYTFSNGTRAYEEVVPDVVVFDGPAAQVDDAISPDFNIGFPLNFGGDIDTNFRVSSNGYLTLVSNGAGVSTAYGGTMNSTFPANARIIAAHDQDLHSYGTGVCGIKYLGAAPNRVTVIQWKNWQRYGQIGLFNLNFQIRIYEGSNRIELCYGAATTSTTNTYSAQVGIRVGENTNVLALNSTTTWADAVANTTNTNRIPVTATVLPDSSRLFTFAPIPPATNDISLSRISGLPSGALCDSSSISFNVLIRNIGTSTLAPTLLAQLIRNGVVINTIPYTGTAIAGGATQNACFSGVDVQGRGNYTIRVVNLTTDDVDVNDTLLQNFAVNRNCSNGGYTVAQSTATYTPLTTSTSPLPGIFSGFGTVTLPFTFVYNGQPYTQATITSSGLVIPGANGLFTGILPLSNNRNSNIIAPFGDDLDNLVNFDETDAYRVQYAIVGTAPNRSLVAQFTDLYVPGFSAAPVPDSSTFSFQTIINENQSIGFHYGNMFANNAALRPVQIGLNLGNDSTFYHLDFATPCTPSYSGLTDAGNISNASEYGTGVLPANGTLITFTPPPITTTDLAIGNVTGVPTGTQNCDSSSFSVTALISNVSSLPITGVAVNAYIVNVTNNDTVQTLLEVISTELTAFANAPITFRNIRVSGAATYRVILSLVNIDGNLTNNTFTSTDFGTVVCAQFPYVFSRGIEPFVPIDVADETVLIAGPNDDGGFGPFNLPFSVLVGTNLQTQYSVGSNGGLAFGTASAAAGGLLGFTDNSIAALGYDAYVRGGTSYVRSATIGTTPNRVHIIEWTGQGSYSAADRVVNNTFQIRIAESGEITIHYGNMGPIAGNYTPQVGFRLTGDVYNVRRMNFGDTSWTNAGAGLNTSTMQLNANSIPRNGFYYRWTPPVRTGADFAVNGFLGNVTNNFCDSNTVTFGALVSNISTSVSTGVIVVGEIVNTTTNAVVASQEVVITDNIPAFGVDTAVFVNLTIPGPGTYALRARILNVDDDTLNNRRTSGSFTVITCVPFPYTLDQGIAAYTRLDSTTATRVIPANADDVAYGPFNLPFPIMLGGNGFTQFTLNSNGQLRFGATRPNAAGYTLTTTNSLAAANFDLLVRGGASTVYADTIGEFPFRTFVVEWRNVSPYNFSNPADQTSDLNFQIRINEDGIVTFHYGTFGPLTGTYNPQVGIFLTNTQFNLRTMLLTETDWANNLTATNPNGALILNSTIRPADGFFFQYTPRPTGVTPEISISAPNAVITACSVQTVPLNVVLTSNTTFPVARGAVFATVTTPSGATSTFSQNFANIVTNGGTFNVSLGNIEVSELGTYAINYVVATVNDGVVSNDFATVTVIRNGPDAAPVVTNVTGINTICGTNSVTLQAPDGAAQYLWSNGATTREIVVANRGSFTVQTRSATGCLSLPSEAVAIDSAVIPTVNFTATADRLSVIVNGTSTGASSVGYFWTGGASVGQANDTITFAAAGTYSISFYGVGICGNDTLTQSVSVIDGITPSDAAIGFVAGTRNFCQNATASYAAIATNTGTNFARLQRVVYTVTSPSNVVTSDSTDVTNVLSVGGTTTFTSRDLVLSEAGTYTVTATLRVENDGALTNNTVSETFTVQGAITAPVITSGVTAICAGGSTTITTANPAAGTSFIWSNGAATQSISVTEAGTYTLRLVNGVCTSAVSNEVTVSVNPLPATPTVTVTGNTTLCGNETATLAAPTGFASYIWSNGAATETITVNASGNYSVQVISAAGCTSTVSATTGIVNRPVTATPSITAGGALSFCVGSNVVLTAPVSGSYTWSTGATTRSITVSDNQTVWVQTTDANSCISARSAEVVTAQVALPAQPLITASRPATFCAGDSAILELPAGFATYAWSNGATTRTITVRNAVSVTGTVTNQTGCISPVSAPVATTVNPLTLASFDFTALENQNKVIVTNTSTNGTSHVFRYNGGTSTRTSDTIAFTAPGSYSITLISTNACGSDSVTRNVVLSSKTSGIAKYVSAYPNPANNFVNVDFGTLQFSEATITMLDVTGKVVLTTTATGNTRLDIANLPAAVYNVRVAVAGEAPANFSVVKR